MLALSSRLRKRDKETKKYRAPSGQECFFELNCKNCLIPEAIKKKNNYRKKLWELNCCVNDLGPELRWGEFVEQIAHSAFQNSKGKIKEKEVWKRLRQNSKSKIAGNKEAKKFNDTELQVDNAEKRKTIDKYAEAANTAAQELIDYIKDPKFQDHLIKSHAHKDKNDNDIDHLTPAEALEFYDVSDGKKRKIRDIDHLAAFLTEELYLTKNGIKFLGELLDKDKLANTPAFEDVWGYFTKSKSAIEDGTASAEALGKLFYNLMPVIKQKIDLLITEQNILLIDDIMKDKDLNNIFTFLDNKFGTNIKSWLKDRAVCFGDKATGIINEINSGSSNWEYEIKKWKNSLDNASNDPDFKKGSALKKIDCAWINITLDIISFSISVSKITSDFKKAKIKDWLSAFNDLSGLAKTAAETYEAGMIVKSLDATGDDIVKYGLKAKQAARFAKGFGVAAGVLTAVTGTMSVIEGIQRKDMEVVYLNLAGVGLAAGGIYATIVGASITSGVLAVAGIALAVAMMLILDPPVLNYLEDQYWGKDSLDKDKSKKIKKEDTISAFYTVMFTIDLQYKTFDGELKDESGLIIISNAMSDTTPVYVEIIDSSQKSYDLKTIFPINKNVGGKGRIVKDLSTWHEKSIHTKKLYIKKLWEIWEYLKDDKQYDIWAGIDPEGDVDLKTRDKKKISEMILNKKISAKLDIDMEPVILKTFSHSMKLYNTDVLNRPAKLAVLKCPQSGKISVNAYTKYGLGCTLRIITKKRNYYLYNEVMSDKNGIKVEGKKLKGSRIETTIETNIKVPESGKTYHMMLEMELYNSDNKKIDSWQYKNEVTLA